MEKKTILRPVFKTERIKTGEVEEAVYLAFDGKQFQTERQCKQYEDNLLAIKEGEGLVKPFILEDNDQYDDICRTIFSGWNTSNIRFFKCLATKDPVKKEKIWAYLKAQGCYNIQASVATDEEGDEILICSWIEGEDGDYPDYYTRSTSYKNIIKVFEEKINKVKQVFNQ